MRFLSLVTVALSLAVPSLCDERIIFGSPTKPGEFESFVLLLEKGEAICGGVAVNEKTVITAAHCVESQKRWYTIAKNDLSLDEFGFLESAGAISVIDNGIASKYNASTSENDIAILKLVSALPPPYAEIEYNASYNGDLTYVGFGANSEYPYFDYGDEVLYEGSEELYQITLKQGKFGEYPCPKKWRGIELSNTKQVCPYSDEYTDSKYKSTGLGSTCYGDSGGPGYGSNGKVVTLVSKGPRGCNREGAVVNFAIDTRLSGYKKFLQNKI